MASTPPSPRARPRDLGVVIGRLPAGPTDSIVDVAHVRVGHTTIWRDEPPPPAGRGVARTGVTAIVPFEAAELFGSRVPAGAAVINGAGEAIGITTIAEWGVLESPILLTSSMAIGRVYDAAVGALIEAIPEVGDDDALLPVVGECDDGWLDTSRVAQLEAADVRAALDGAVGAAAGPVPGGAVGAGTGMVCFELKGGIGSASRRVAPDAGPDGATYTVGALVLANFGRLPRLTIDGVPVGRVLSAEGVDRADHARERERGSCVVVIATDAPLGSAALDRLARRAALGLGRVGSTAGHGSGEISIAFSTGVRIPRSAGTGDLGPREPLIDGYALDPFFEAVVDVTEAAVVDALFRADTVIGRDGHTAIGLPVARTLECLREAGRLAG